MTDLTSAQLTALTAILLSEEPRRAANKEKALSRLVATAEGHGLQGIKKIVALPFDEAKAKVEAHAAKLTAETSDRPGDAFEQQVEVADMEKAAEALTRPRKRRPVSVTSPGDGKAPQRAPSPATGGKPWFRNGDMAEARMLAVMVEVGPSKLAAFRAKFAEGQDAKDEWDALSQTQQNGILIRAMDKLMLAGKLTRDGLTYGVKPEFAKAA